ncbi:MAG: FecR domain-containing protein [Prolixibacteraceae bacterium]|nr:FecR domain-containing protein [Prolixibacteraceae bacterium]
MKYTDDILQIVTGNMKGIHKNEVLSQLLNDKEACEEYRKIKNAWALASSTKEMSESQVENLYMNFQKQLAIKQKSFRIFSSSFIKYAAILILALSIGAVGFWDLYQNQKSYVYSTIAESGKNGMSQLHLSNGTTVNLEKDNSKIALSADQKVTIDNEKVIDLKNKTSQADDSKMNEVVVPFGRKSQLTLEDGTKVWLNAGSRMAFPTKFKGNKREVFLEGEGYFEVAHNQKLPFYVNTDEIAIKVLGTKFNISAYGSEKLIEAVLIEGSIVINERSALSFIKSGSILMPNQKASYDRNDRSIVVKEEPNVDDAIAWTEGWLKFHRQSINDVLNKLQRYYNVQFDFNAEFPAEDLITGKLYLNDSIEQVMLTMEVVAKLQYRISGNKIYVGKKM